MATQKKRADRRNAPRQEFNPRDLLLAGVGAVSLGRKQAIRSIEQVPQTIDALRKRVAASVKSLESKTARLTREAEGDFRRLRDQADGDLVRLRMDVAARIASLKKKANAQVGPLQQRLDEVVVQVANQAQRRLGPVFAKFGAPPARRPAKAARRKTARKAA